MNRLVISLVVALSGCFQPVVQVVGDCSGSCPRGECNSVCSSTAATPCDSPESCLRAYDCSKGSSCDAYRTDPIDFTNRSSACANTDGVYCAGVLTPEGKRRSFVVDCRDGMLSVVPCARPGDGGARPQACMGVCRVTYDVQ